MLINSRFINGILLKVKGVKKGLDEFTSSIFLKEKPQLRPDVPSMYNVVLLL